MTTCANWSENNVCSFSLSLSDFSKVPNMEVDKNENKFFTSWDPQRKVFTMQAGIAIARSIERKGKMVIAIVCY